jgi:hypothetical protein
MRRSILLAVALATAAFAPVRKQDIPVHSYFLDVDATGTPYTLQSDGAGGYSNGVANVVSVLTANVFNNLYNGDWVLDTRASSTRTVAITLATSNAVPAGAQGYTVAPDPPFWGTGFEAARLIDTCTEFNKSVLTMTAGATMTCPLVVRWDMGGSTYRLDMGFAPESTPAQITCSAMDVGGCKDWFLDPIPVVNADGTVSAGTATARVESVAKNGSITNLGDFYMTFHFHVTRP